MDDEATRLLREIRDLLTESATRDVAWHDEMRINFQRSRRLCKLIMVPLLILGFGMVAWGIYSSLYPPPESQPTQTQFRRPA